MIRQIKVITSVFMFIAYTISRALHYSSFLPAIPPPIPPNPERPYKPTPDFQRCERLQKIIAQVRNHIATSSSTRDCFVIVSRRLDRMLDDPTRRAHLSEDSQKLLRIDLAKLRGNEC
jgi:hypothetical protein